VRTHLGMRKWHLVFGGSWGATLGLLYAQTHPAAIGHLVLRGILLFRARELDWLYRSLAPHLFPDVHEPFVAHIPAAERDDLPRAYYRRLVSDDVGTRTAAALRWNTYETALATLTFDSDSGLARMGDMKWLIEHARLEAHYAVNAGFLDEGQLLREENVDRMRHIPGECVRGDPRDGLGEGERFGVAIGAAAAAAWARADGVQRASCRADTTWSRRCRAATICTKSGPRRRYTSSGTLGTAPRYVC
jgi:proline iminopeptidase